MDSPHAAGSEQSRSRGAAALGLLGIALGASHLLAPDEVAKLLRLRPRSATRWWMRAVGVGQILSGASLLARRGGALPALFRPIHVVRSITINRPPETVYRFWRNLENLPRFMAHLESVTDLGERSVWRAKAPAGTSIQWTAEVTADHPNERIAWRSLEGASVPNSGGVCFLTPPNGRGTEVVVDLHYEPPAGAVGAAVAKLFGEEPGQQISGDLRRLKQVLETGSVVHSDASIHHGLHPARPAAADETTHVLGRSES